MSETTIDSWTKVAREQPLVMAAVLIAIGGTLTILGAWFFQYGLGLSPCPLCLEQRYPYYFAIPLAVLVLMGASVGSSRKVLLAALAMIALGMIWNAALGVYHAGIEWKFWPGPQACSGAVDFSGDNPLRDLDSVVVVRCDEAAWRFLGISLAGYNVLISLALASIAVWGLWAARRQRLAGV